MQSWGAITYYSSNQRIGDYRCSSITVMFGDGIEGGPTAPDEYWGGAYVNGEEKLLIYSHFNGVYVEDGEYSCQFCMDAKDHYQLLTHTHVTTST